MNIILRIIGGAGMFVLERIQMQLDKVDGWIRSNRYKSLGIVLGIGIFIGAIF